MSWHTPERKIEQALKRYLETTEGTEFDGVQIVTRFSNNILIEPRIEIVCESCEPWPDSEGIQNGTGNWRCEVTISVVSHYEKEVDAVSHDQLAGYIADMIITETLVDDVMQTQTDEDITIFDIWCGSRANSIEEKKLKTEQKLTALIAPSQL